MREFTVEHNGILFTIKRDTQESIDVFLQRSWYIINKSEQDKSEKYKSDFNELIDKSLIWRNVTIYGMNYNKEILSII
jgi:hypothetical protein|tara:strand:+ start:246 stop:479 length:234 start_codon:yes stop_codon:yes gene_type:complete